LLVLAALIVVAGAGGSAQSRRVLFPVGGGPVATHGEVQDCAECHEAIVREWRLSAHATSWTNPVFQSEYAPAEQAFCRNCHAPRASSADVRGAARHGVDCAVCHTRGGQVLGRRGRGAAEHPVRIEAELGRTSFCAPCHEFAFPERRPGARRPTYLPGRPLQATVSEHQASDSSDESCQSCHMPRVDGHVDHRFPGLNDPSMLRRAVGVSARARRGPGGRVQVRVRLTPREIGHAFPTGDMFRQGRFEVSRGPDRAVERLQRWFSRVPGGDAFYMAQVDDTRVPPTGAYTFTLELPPGDGPIRYRLDIWRLDPDTARRRGLSEDSVRVPVTSGRVRW